VSLAPRIQRWRDWFPIPTSEGGLGLIKWALLEAHRLAVTGALLTLVFGVLMVVGTVWPFEMQRLLTETSAVQTVLNTFLSGMILLVSIVVSINSIVLSHDITSVERQDDRITGAMDFRREIGALTGLGERPSDPATFLKVMSQVIRDRAQALADGVDGADGEITEATREYTNTVVTAAEQLGAVDETAGGEFAVLWKGIEFDYGTYIDRSRTLKSDRGAASSEALSDRVDHLVDAFKLFAIGKEYFKTLYYTQEVSRLSRMMLIVTLPSIIFNASTSLAINAGLLPTVWILGLPPLHSFVATAFTISLAPYLVFTSYMLRLSTVAWRTSSGGIFSLT